MNNLLQLALDALNSGDVLQRTRAVVELEKALSMPPQATPKAYWCCDKHMGQPFTIMVAVAPAMVTVCPHCEAATP